MKPKITFIAMMVLLCFVWGLFVVVGYSATAKQNPKTAHENMSGDMKSTGTCADINPEVGTIIENAQIGYTWYDEQQIGSMGHMISVTPDGHREASWTFTNGAFPANTRYIKANCAPAGIGGWIGMYTVDGGPTGNTNAGYSNQTHLSDGTPIVIYHRPAGTPTPWYSTIAAEDEACGGLYTRKWDIPDWIFNSPTANPMEWPKGEVQHDTVTGRDYIHVVGTEGNTASGAPVMIAYERCYIKPGSTIFNDTMKCQTYRDGATQTDIRLPGQNGAGTFFRITHFDSSCNVTPIVTVSPVSSRVAIAFLKPNNPSGACDRFSDVCYVESMNLGDDWIDGTNWPPPERNITNYGSSYTERAYVDVAACYDYEDSLHIVWNAHYYDPSSNTLYPIAKLYHWSKKFGITLIASGYREDLLSGKQMAPDCRTPCPRPDTKPGNWSGTVCKPSIAAVNPIYHPDSTFLYCIWTQFNPGDTSESGYGNGDIYTAGSGTGGECWTESYNLTNTKTPDCSAGNCLSEHWASLAISDTTLHIQYICDRDAGAAVQNEGTWSNRWTDNPVMYLHLTQWPIANLPHLVYRIESPSEWYNPPLKVTPNGTRTLILKVFSVGCANLIYGISSSNPCIQCNVPPTVLAPRDSDAVAVVLQGSGTSCKNKFISGYITLTSNQPSTDNIDIQFVSDSAFYECPRDPLTYDSLENGVLRMYVNANTQEWIEDIGTYAPDTVHQVFFQGGAFVAVTQNSDTLVGRYMGQNDQHALARETLKLNGTQYNSFWLEYSWNVSIHDLNPPVDTKWWWFDILHENVFFKTSASDDLKHTVIKFITIERHNPPNWWPSQPSFAGYEDTYIGMMMDIDAPWDTLGSQTGRNWAGYDATNNIAWQKGWQLPGNPHPEYADYYAGMALIAGGQLGESTVPYGTQNVRNDSTVYKVSPWGWRDGLFYRLAKDNTIGAIQDPDSLVDRSQIVTARKIVAASPFAPVKQASFTIVEAVGTTGLANLQSRVAAARTWVATKPLILCGDVNNSGSIEVGDIVTLLNYLYKNFPPSVIIGPPNRADCNSSGAIEVGDIVTIINYLYKNYPASTVKCPGVW